MSLQTRPAQTTTQLQTTGLRPLIVRVNLYIRLQLQELTPTVSEQEIVVHLISNPLQLRRQLITLTGHREETTIRPLQHVVLLRRLITINPAAVVGALIGLFVLPEIHRGVPILQRLPVAERITTKTEIPRQTLLRDLPTRITAAHPARTTAGNAESLFQVQAIYGLS